MQVRQVVTGHDAKSRAGSSLPGPDPAGADPQMVELVKPGASDICRGIVAAV
jgi:hypothetical protein